MRLNCHVLWTWSDLYHLAANGRAAFIVISCPKHIYGMISRVVIIQGTERFTEIQQLMYQYSGWDALGFPSHRVRFTQLQCTSTCVHILSIVCQSVMLVNNLRSCCFDYLCHREKYVVGVGDSNAVVLQVMYMYREGKINKEWRQRWNTCTVVICTVYLLDNVSLWHFQPNYKWNDKRFFPDNFTW